MSRCLVGDERQLPTATTIRRGRPSIIIRWVAVTRHSPPYKIFLPYWPPAAAALWSLTKNTFSSAADREDDDAIVTTQRFKCTVFFFFLKETVLCDNVGCCLESSQSTTNAFARDTSRFYNITDWVGAVQPQWSISASIEPLLRDRDRTRGGWQEGLNHMPLGRQ